MAVVYAAHFLGAPEGWRFTGFLQYDQPAYMAFAREYFDHGFSGTYGVPFSHDPETPKVYFHLHLLALGTLHRFTGWDPGYLYVAFGTVFGIAMFRTALALLETVIGRLQRPEGWLTAVAFLWGGGLLWLPGAIFLSSNVKEWSYSEIRHALFLADPFDGYWFLNLGRNVYLSVEAYYHVLFFGSVVAILRARYLLSGWVGGAALAVSPLVRRSTPPGGYRDPHRRILRRLVRATVAAPGARCGGMARSARYLLSLHLELGV
jgi:hypothetical protein